jgi:hypothetical protein
LADIWQAASELALQDATLANRIKGRDRLVCPRRGEVIHQAFHSNSREEARIAETGLAPNDPKEAAVFAALPVGSNTAIVRGAGETTGNALVEVYSVR